MFAFAPTFDHGVHPRESKRRSSAEPIERMPFVERYVLPLRQHIGAPANLVVKVGDDVQRGQVLAQAGGFVSTALHAPVSGRVIAVEKRANPVGKPLESIVIQIDPLSSQQLRVESKRPSEAGSAQGFADAIRDGGIVGMGGAAFPTHVKMVVPDGGKVDVLILNGCECEPYLTCDHRIMLERPAAVVEGGRMMARQLGAERFLIGVERNKMDAVNALRAESSDAADVRSVAVKYPQGAEKMLIDALLKRRVAVGKLPIDVGVVVQNVATAAALSDLDRRGMPLIERVVTVSGAMIASPRNLLVPIGTPVDDLLEFAGLTPSQEHLIVLGGPMMGSAQKDLSVPVVKGTSGVLAFAAPQPLQEQPCIKCGRCLSACPMALNPTRLYQLVRTQQVQELQAHHIQACFECGSCAFACPSHIPLAHYMRLGKALARRSGRS